MENVIRDFTSFGLGGLVIGGALLFAFLRKPKFRTWVLGWKVFGKSLIKIAMLTMIFISCTNGNATTLQRKAPRFHPNKAVAVTVVGPDLQAVITWTPGTTDSMTFSATRGGAPVGQITGVPVFSGVDTMALGARPAPGVTYSFEFRAEGTYIDRGAVVGFNLEIGSASYTEPQPAGVPPSGFGVGVDSNTASGPPPPVPTLIAIDILAADADSFTVAGGYWMDTGQVVQFCAMALMSDGFWQAADDGVGTVPQICSDSASARNALGAVSGADLWMIRMAQRSAYRVSQS